MQTEERLEWKWRIRQRPSEGRVGPPLSVYRQLSADITRQPSQGRDAAGSVGATLVSTTAALSRRADVARLATVHALGAVHRRDLNLMHLRQSAAARQIRRCKRSQHRKDQRKSVGEKAGASHQQSTISHLLQAAHQDSELSELHRAHIRVLPQLEPDRRAGCVAIETAATFDLAHPSKGTNAELRYLGRVGKAHAWGVPRGDSDSRLRPSAP